MTCPFHDSDDEQSARDTQLASGESALERRSFLKTALAIGGSAALSSAGGLYGLSGRSAAAIEPDDPVGVAERANRQHAWDAYEYYDETKETSIPPERHVLLLADYRGDGEPSAGHRRAAAAAFDGLEEAFEWSSDGLLFTVGYSPAYFERFDESLPPGLDPAGSDKPGLLTADALVEMDGVTLDRERPVARDDYDVAIHLASDSEQVLLAAEELLWTGETTLEDEDGEETELTLPATLEGVLERPTEYPDRRVGFAGTENLKEEGGAGSEGGIYPPEVPVDRDEGADAKLSMGFNDLFRNSIPRETNATILEDQKLVEPKPPGAFAQGSVQHISKLDLNLDPDGEEGFEGDEDGDEEGWYAYSDEERIERMFSPHHSVENTGVVGDELGNSTAPGDRPLRDLSSEDPDVAELTEADAKAAGVVGHAQKTARARFDLEERTTDDLAEDDPAVTEATSTEDGDDYQDLRGHDGTQQAEQVMLRRDFDTVDGGTPGLHFVSLMRFNPYMAYMRAAMNGVEFDTAVFGLDGDGQIAHENVDVDPDDNGIVNFVTTQRRGNFLVPPLDLRALPPARAEEVDLDVRAVSSNDDDDGGSFVVEATGLDGTLDPETVRFGHYRTVNRGGGAAPETELRGKGRAMFKFDAEATEIGDDRTKARFVGKLQGSRLPVRGTARLED